MAVASGNLVSLYEALVDTELLTPVLGILSLVASVENMK